MEIPCFTPKSVLLTSDNEASYTTDKGDIKNEDMKIDIDEESWRNCLNEPSPVLPERNAARTVGATSYPDNSLTLSNKGNSEGDVKPKENVRLKREEYFEDFIKVEVKEEVNTEEDKEKCKIKLELKVEVKEEVQGMVFMATCKSDEYFEPYTGVKEEVKYEK